MTNIESVPLLNDFTIEFSLDTASLIAAGKLNPDCSDLRVVYQSSQELDWVYQLGSVCNSPNTVIAFALQAAIPAYAIESDYAIYYGNAFASLPVYEENRVYLFRDDFGDNAFNGDLDPALWEWSPMAIPPTIANGVLVFNADDGRNWEDYVQTIKTFDRTIMNISFTWLWKKSNSGTWSIMGYQQDAITNKGAQLYDIGNAMHASSQEAGNVNMNINVLPGVWYEAEVRPNPDLTSYYRFDVSERLLPETKNNYHFGLSDGDGEDIYFVDDLVIRYHVSNPPFIDPGSEELFDGNGGGPELFQLTSIVYRLKANPTAIDVYVPQKVKLSKLIKNPEALLGLDFFFQGMSGPTGVSIFKMDSSGDDSYTLKFTSQEGLDYTVPLMDNSGDGGEGSKYGDEDDELYFRECGHEDSLVTSGPNAVYCIQKNDMFVLTSNWSNTHVLAYESIDTINNKLLFTDLGMGQIEITYDPAYPKVLGGQEGRGEIILGGGYYPVYVGNATNNYSLAIDLNDNRKIDDNDIAKIFIDSGGILDLGTQCTNALKKESGRPIMATNDIARICDTSDVTSVNITLVTKNKQFNENGPNNGGGDENITINITQAPLNTIDLNVLHALQCIQPSISIYKTGLVMPACEPAEGEQYTVLKMVTSPEILPGVISIHKGYSTYGILFEQVDEDDMNDADEVTVEYPDQQLFADVFIATEADY
ncbi:hypothetical protein HYS48_00225 [Candidatus Woesearchaeota archaeon]|nr:hypothetical protein [Candidatus Woesearchaeota archaeon]